MIGSKNNIKNDSQTYSGVASSILGAANTIKNSNGVTIQGTGNTVTGAYKDMGLDFWDSLSVWGGNYSVLAEKESGAIAIIGGANTISNQTSSTVIGFGNTLKGKNSTGVFTAGSHNKLTNVSNSLVMGDNNTLTNRKNVISLGNQNTVTADNAVAIGNGTKVTKEGGVAIGVDSVADRVAESEKGARGEFAPDTIPTGQESTWTSTKGAVSVGDTANNITRQITNVAAGREDTDAVNVAQLKRAKTTVSDGINTTVTSTVAEDGHTDYKVNLNKDLIGIESISNGSKGQSKIVLNEAYTGMAYGDTNVVLRDNGVYLNGKVNVDKAGQIHNVTAGTADEDAVNVSQLKKQTAASKTTVSDGTNTTVTSTTVAEDGHTDYKVNLNKDLTGIESISNGSKGQSKIVLNEAYTGMAYGDTNVVLMNNGVYLNGKVNVDKAGQIHNVTAGTADEDAVNVSQLKGVESIANQGWNLSTNGVATEATNVAPGAYVDFSGDDNITVSKEGTNVTTTLNKDLKGIESISNGPSKVVLNEGYAGMAYGNTNVVLMNNGVYLNGKVNVDKAGQIHNVTAGTADEDAVNVSQLKGVESIANQGWNLSTNGVATEATKVAPGDYVDFSGDDNITVSKKDTKVKVELNKDINVNSVQTNALNSKYNLSVGTAAADGKMPFFVNSNGAFYAAGGEFVVDKDGSVKATSGDIGNVKLNNGVFYKNSALRDGELYVGDADGNYSQITSKNAKLGKVTIDDTGRISGVEAGRIAADSTDAVNGSQLHAVQQEAGKHTKVVNGSNITVEETDQDGQKTYKVGLNKDILLGDITGKNVSISGINGTIETTGYIATKDRVYADKGAKLADVDITGDTISNDKSSVKLDKEGTVTVNNKVTIDGNGKVSGVAAGEISNTSTDAVNGSQLKETNDRVTNVENNVKNIQGDITNIKGDITNIKGDITTIKGDVTILGDRVTKVEQEAGKHTKVVNGSNVTVEETDQDGQKTYKVGLNKDLLLGDITGKNVSISGTNGTIETTGSIATKDKIYADKGAKLADIDITGDTISNGQSSVKLDKEGTVTINGKVSVNQNGKVSGVAAGDISATSTDVVNGSQLFATNQQVVQNAQSISKLGNRINKVGAGAAALAALHPLDFDPDAKWDFAAGYGNYRGANAAAVGAYYRPNEDTMFSVGGSFGNGENMVNAGVSFKLGSGSSHVSTSRVAMAKEIKELRGELEAMKSAMLDANAGKKIDTSKLQLFPDVPQNHWAYEYVAQLAGNGMIEGYPDGNFAGDRPMTRYEFAAILYRAMTKGAVLSDKILSEFSHELEYFTVDTIAKDKAGNPTIQRVRTVKENKNK